MDLMGSVQEIEFLRSLEKERIWKESIWLEYPDFKPVIVFIKCLYLFEKQIKSTQSVVYMVTLTI